MVSVPNFYHKKVKDTKIAISVPVRDHVTAVFTQSLAMLMKRCGETGQKVSLHMVMGSEVAMQRQQLVDEILATDCTHILWLDSDMGFPTFTIEALLGHEKDIVACNYSTRVSPHRPVAFTSQNHLDERVTSGSGLQEIVAVGLGCMLVRREVYENISRPFFSVEWNDNYTNLVGEDIYFCQKAKSYKYKIWLDNDLSEYISHIGTRAYTIKGDCK
jgi:hypothetical protein